MHLFKMEYLGGDVMGRGRLTRRISLEVITEEESSDFCSHLDSLEPRPSSPQPPESFSNQNQGFYSPPSSVLITSTTTSEDSFFYLDLDFENLEEFSIDSLWDQDFKEIKFDQNIRYFSPTLDLDSNQVLKIMDQNNSSEEIEDQSLKDLKDFIEWEEFSMGVEATEEIHEKMEDQVDTSSIFNNKTREIQVVCEKNEKTRDKVIIPDLIKSNSKPQISRSRSSSGTTEDSLDIEIKNLTGPHVVEGKKAEKIVEIVQINQYQSPEPTEDIEIPLDVKKVRALFETNSNSNFNAFLAKNSAHPSSEICGTKSNQNLNKIRSAFSQMSIHQIGSSVSDFSELLVNDKVIIEESTDDIFTNSTRHRRAGENPNIKSLLKRSKSLASGICRIGSTTTMTTTESDDHEKNNQNNKNPSILAEELPPPDMVKNVRNVFEKMAPKTSASSDHTLNQDHGKCKSQSQSPTSPSESPFFSNKFLSAIKSNPTSKIFRSESMREPSTGTSSISPPQRYGKPILMSSAPYEKINLMKSLSAPGNGTAPGGKSGKMNSQTPKPPNSISSSPDGSRRSPGTSDDSECEFEESRSPSISSTSSNYNHLDDYISQCKLIPQEVLNSIRSYGTSTTYFGGEIVAKTVKNRKLSLGSNIDIMSRTPMMMMRSDFFQCPNYINENSSKNSSTPPLCSKSFTKNLKNLENDPHFIPINKCSKINTAPRIISVVPKSPQTKSPTILEGRNSPEGAESSIIDDEKLKKVGGSNNNTNLLDMKFAQINNGAWF